MVELGEFQVQAPVSCWWTPGFQLMMVIIERFRIAGLGETSWENVVVQKRL